MKYRIKNVLACSIYIMLIIALVGCATQMVSPPLSSKTNTDIVRPSWLASNWNIMYSPQLHPGKTIDDALADIEKYLCNDATDIEIAYEARDTTPTWYRMQRCTVNAEIISIKVKDNNYKSIDINLNVSVLPEYTIYVVQTRGNTWNYGICLHGLVSFYFKHPTNVQQIADAIFFIQQHANERHEQKLELFKSQAAQYRALAIKPAMSEEQRKLVVQANTMNRLKDYAGAISLYLKAIDLDSVSYPEAYFNLALINAQIKQYDAAIGYMKQYLMLVPDAKDSRSAQDKIYEWEIIEKKQK